MLPANERASPSRVFIPFTAASRGSRGRAARLGDSDSGGTVRMEVEEEETKNETKVRIGTAATSGRV